MKRPAINPENHIAIRDDYRERKPSASLLGAVHTVNQYWFRPYVHTADNAVEQVLWTLNKGTNLLIAINHILKKDPFVVGGAIHTKKELRAMESKIVMPAKPLYYVKYPGARTVLDALGARVVFRPKEEEDISLFPELTNIRLAGAAAESTYETLSEDLRDMNVAFHPEHTRNKTRPPNKLLPIQRGLGRVARKAYEKGVDTAIWPIVIWYGDDIDKRRPRPYVYLGNVIDGPFPDDRQTTGIVKTALDEGLERIIAIEEAATLSRHP